MVGKSLKIAAGLVLSAAAWASRPGDFQVIGPGGGGAQYHPTISPYDPNTVLVSCDMTGGYITHDGGQSWRMFNLRDVIRSFAFDRSDRQVIYAQTALLWRSRNNGETWELVYPTPQSVRGVQMDSDHADETVIADPDPLGIITAFAVSPKNSGELYLSTSKNGQPALFVSRDAGETWAREATLPEPAIFIAPEKDFILAVGNHTITSVTVAAVKTQKAPSNASFTSVSAGFSTNGQVTIYAASDKGAFVSHDKGVSWQQCVLPGRNSNVGAIATSLRHPDTAYLSFHGLELDGQTWEGMAKTQDAGQTWNLLWKENREAPENVADAWITKELGPAWSEYPLTLGVAPDNPSLCYATDLGRTLKTTDGGAHWQAVYSHETPHGWRSSGLDVTTSYGIHFDPFNHARQFISYTDIGLFRSEDGGNSWLSSTNGVPQPWRNTTYWVVFDPAVPGRMWSVNSGTHDLPRPKMWRHTSVLTYRGGVCRSDDGGRTWTESNNGMEETAGTHILLDERSPVNARTLYVTAFGRGVYKSTDGGLSWTLKNNGITQWQPFAWRLVQAFDGTLYVLIARRSENGAIDDAGDGAIYQSTNAAETWSKVLMPHGANAPNGLAISPQSAKRLYLAAWARAVGTHGEGGGIYVSDDAGSTWRQTLSQDQHVYDITIDPHNPDILYAAGFESSAWRSTDRGEHWSRISGFNFKWGHRVIVDPSDESSVYITTFGGSVWHGRVNGPNQPVDIATSILQPGRIP